MIEYLPPEQGKVYKLYRPETLDGHVFTHARFSYKDYNRAAYHFDLLENETDEDSYYAIWWGEEYLRRNPPIDLDVYRPEDDPYTFIGALNMFGKALADVRNK